MKSVTNAKKLKCQENLLQLKGEMRNNQQPNKRGQIYDYVSSVFVYVLIQTYHLPSPAFCSHTTSKEANLVPGTLLTLALCRKINGSVLPSEFVILHCFIFSDCKWFEEINNYGF